MKTSYKPAKEIYALIDRTRLFEAINLIGENDTTNVCRNIIDECSNNYRYLLKYFEESTPGTSDPSRAIMVGEIKESLRRAADLLEAAYLERESSDTYFTTRRNMRVHRGSDISSVLTQINTNISRYENAKATGKEVAGLRSAIDSACEHLFSRVWTQIHLTNGEQESIQTFLTEGGISEVDIQAKALVLTALLLGCIMYYDYRKLELLLMSSLQVENTRLAARALTGTLMLIGMYAQRIKENKKIMALADAVADNNRLQKATRQYGPAMLRAIDTDRVNKRVKEDIFPSLTRMKPELEKTLRRMGGELEGFDFEGNPDWEELFKKSGVTDKLKELTEMQMDGADIFMSAFSQMKGFSFFRHISNWFVPFSLNHSQVEGAHNVVPETLLKMLTRGNFFCSSDKYSMVLALSKMPPQQFQMMSSQLSEQMVSMQEDAETSLLGDNADISAEIALYLKDLYRFFRLKNDDLPDPFGQIYEIPDLPPFKALGYDIELQRGMAEFYFKYGYWQQAYHTFETVGKLSPSADESLLQKQGYCMQLTGHHDEALKHYMQAELLNPQSDWLLKRIATLLRDMKRYDESAEYARRALARKPDNLNLEMLLGTTLMLGDNPEAALKSFYKIKYLAPDNTKVLRPIAWCEFMMGNYEKSAGMYGSMPDTTATDMLNCGHSFMAMGQIASATRCYRTCAGMLPAGADEFRSLMKDDMPYLNKAGVKTLDISLATELALSAQV